MSGELTIKKTDGSPHKRMVWAEVYAPNRPDVDGEFMTAEEIEKMAHDFVRKGRLDQIDVQHDNTTVKGVQAIESFIARKGDPDFIEGSWVLGVHVDNDAVWQDVLDGKINGFSMEAMVTKEEVEVEIEIPPVVMGRTSVDEDHEHQFFVTYGEDGTFQGGVTDEVNGHKHVIKGGTITEKASGHQHRFSSVDNVQIVGDVDG